MPKKRILKWSVLPILLLLAVLFFFFYNRVPGHRISNVEKIDKSCTITLTRWEYLESNARQTRQLTPELNLKLKQLIEDTTFRRTRGSGKIQYTDPHVYEIEIAFPDQTQPLKLRVFGGEYLSLPGNESSCTLLHIWGDLWVQPLEDLFQKSQIVAPELS